MHAHNLAPKFLRAHIRSLFATTRRSVRSVRRADHGSSMVEMALCLPLLLTVVLGITTFGVAVSNYLTLTEATSVGARQLAISRGQTLDPCSYTSNIIYAAAPTLTKGSFTFAYTLNGTKYTGTSCSSLTSITGAAGNMQQGSTAVVTVTYPCNLFVYKTNYAPSGCTLTASTTEVMQ